MQVDLVCANVAQSGGVVRALSADVVVTNPPFGTRNKGIDMAFVAAGAAIATGAVYSLHKSSTRAHVHKHAERLGLKPRVVAQLRYDLPKTYRFHKKASLDIEVDFWRFAKA